MNVLLVCRHLASALLPWYLNGGLGPDQHAMVRDHVESCDCCARELADLEAVARAAAPPPFTRESPEPANPPADPSSRHGMRAWLLAVGLAVPAILGLVWVLLGVARSR